MINSSATWPCSTRLLMTSYLRGDYMGATEEVPSSTTHIGSIATLPVGAIQPPGNQVPVRPEELRGSILEHTRQDRQQELLQLLLQFPSELNSSSESTSWLPQGNQPVNNQEPLNQKQGKIPQAHCPVIEETLDSWDPHPQSRFHVQHPIVLPAASGLLPNSLRFLCPQSETTEDTPQVQGTTQNPTRYGNIQT